jgi:16S rRNA (adenine1518-N6/adenine1519-N6)-dimethyltransferase
VGPGGGALTEALLSSGFRVVAIEFDERWCAELSLKFKKYIQEEKLTVIKGDATQVSLLEIQKNLRSDKVTLCGNLPYNRGQEIVFRFFETAAFVDSFVIMLQKEVADKFLPKNTRKLYGPLSIKMHFLAMRMDSFFVSPGSFMPPPKVDSAVLSFKRAEHPLDPTLDKASYDKFSKLLQQSFNQRRKKLANNIDMNEYPDAFKTFATKRAEELSPEDFLKLFRSLPANP